MGRARNHGAGRGRSWWSLRADTPKGAPVPRVSTRHWRKTGTGTNKAGLLTGKVPWQDKWEAKAEDADRNVNNAARRQAIAEQTSDALDQSDDNAAQLDHEDWDRDDFGSPEDEGMDSLYSGDIAPGILFNGEPVETYEDFTYMRTITDLREQLRLANIRGDKLEDACKRYDAALKRRLNPNEVVALRSELHEAKRVRDDYYEMPRQERT